MIRSKAPVSLYPPELRARGCRAFWRIATAALTFSISTAIGALALPSAVKAACTQDGSSVTCDDTDTTGFAAKPGENTLSVTVSTGATIDTPAPGASANIQLNDDNNVSIGSNATILVNGTAVTSTAGIAVGDRNTVTTSSTTNITVTGSGTGHAGIKADDQNTISNNGTSDTEKAIIDVQASGSFGIKVGNGVVTPGTPATPIPEPDDIVDLGNRVDNGQFGEINVTGAGSTGIQAGNNNGTPADVDTSVVPNVIIPLGDGGISNEGTINVDGTGAFGISVGNQNTVVNGTATSDTETIGDINVSGSGAVGVELGDGNDFINIGVISVTGGGIGVLSNSTSSGAGNRIFNAELGQITVTSGTAIQGGAGPDEVENAGTITGDIDLGAGDDTFTLFSGGTNTGNLSGGADSDTFVLSGTADAIFDFNSSSPTLQSFEVLKIGNDEDFRWIPKDGGGRFGWSDTGRLPGTWTLRGNGAFSSEVHFVSGTVALDHTVNLTTAKATFGVESVFQPQLRSGASSDVLNVSGSVVITPIDIQDGAELRPVFDSTQRFDLAIGATTTETVLTASGGGISAFPFFTAPDTPIFTITPVYGANQLDLSITRNSYASAGQSSNQRAVGSYLDRNFTADPSGAVVTAIIPLDTLNAQDLQTAYDQLGPEVFDAQTTAALSTGYFFNTGLAGRPLDCRRRTHETLENEMTSTPTCGRTGWEPWQQVFGQFDQRSGGNVEFDIDSTGAIVGVSKRFNDSFTFSIAAGGSQSSIDFNFGGDGSLTMAQAGISGSYERNRLRFETAISYGHGWHETNRKVTALAASPKSEHESNQVNALFEASYLLGNDRWHMEPLAGVDYSYLEEEAFQEDPASGIELGMSKRNTSLLAASMGVRVSASFPRYRFMTIPSRADGIWTPEFSVRARGIIDGDQRDLTAQMLGAPAGAGGIKVTAKDSDLLAEIGAGISFQPRGKASSMGINYKGLLGNEGSSHQLLAQFRLPLTQRFLIGRIEPLIWRPMGSYVSLD